MGILLRDPKTGKPMQVTESGLAVEDQTVYPLINGAYRIVSDDNYTGNFGYQWNKFAATQIDEKSKITITKSRFFAETGWGTDLSGEKILEVGSGAGRFSSIVLNHTNADLYSVDYSNAVEANFVNNGQHGQRLQLFQASIYELPFMPGQFDKVFCFGVLQHTPDVEQSVKALISMLKPGGELVVDFYPINGWWTKVNAKYMLRPVTKKWSNEKLYKVIDKNVDWMIKAYRFFNAIRIGKITNRFLPLCDINGTLPRHLSPQQLREHCVLDTFDMFSPQYDQPQKITTVVKWFSGNNMKDVSGGFVHFENASAAVVKGIRNP